MNIGIWGKCERKVKYGTRQKALNVIKTIRKRRIMVHGAYVYQCEICGKFHITKRKP